MLHRVNSFSSSMQLIVRFFNDYWIRVVRRASIFWKPQDIYFGGKIIEISNKILRWRVKPFSRARWSSFESLSHFGLWVFCDVFPFEAFGGWIIKTCYMVEEKQNPGFLKERSNLDRVLEVLEIGTKAIASA